MEIPFIYGKVADNENFTNRVKEKEILFRNMTALTNTVLISPRRWGKTSLVNAVLKNISQDDSFLICHLDIFNCRTEEQFYQSFANAILQASISKLEEMVLMVKKYVGQFAPKITMGDMGQTIELTLGVDFKEKKLSFDEILDLAQTIATDRNKKFVVCIDEFQNIANYDSSIEFQRVLRSHWQKHNRVCYCLYGSKRHMLLDIFSNSEMPFYKFGDIVFLDKISKTDWVAFISTRFAETGKNITNEQAGRIADLMHCHPYYVQQLCQQVWFRVEKNCKDELIENAYSDITNQLSLLFSNIIDSLRPKQIAFLQAVANNETNFSSSRVLRKYDLGTSANIKNLRKAVLDKDLIDILPGDKILLQDPVFENWLKQTFPFKD